jgi:TonB-linked SusC/RagA family outer membrane protein
MAQERVISGKVTASEDGTPLPGVNVVIKGTIEGAVTDADGNYKLSYSGSGGVLVFSFIGLKTTEIEIGDRSTIDISLALDVTQLSDIVISGVAGATDKKKMTVSVAKVGEAQLQTVPALSIASALGGKVAGLRTSGVSGAPGQATEILLRGNNVLNGGSSPLILIDGIIMNGSLADINIDDVESIEVVKGAAASALYGSRAGNGVISVQTKRGKGAKAPVITIRNEVGGQSMQHFLDVPQAHAFVLAPDWESFKGKFTKYNGVTYPAGYEGGYTPSSASMPGGDVPANFITGTQQLEADQYMDNPYGVYRNTMDQVFQTGASMVNYVSVQNSTDKNNIMISFENNQQEGVIKGRNGYSRQNFRLNIDQDVTSWLRLSATNLFINRYVQPTAGIFYNVARLTPDVNLYAKNPDGSDYNLVPDPWNNEIQNPLYDLDHNKQKNHSRRWMGAYTANIEFADWANLDLTQTFEIENFRSRTIVPIKTYSRNYLYNEGSIYERSDETTTANTQATLNLNKKFGDLTVKGKFSYLYEDRAYERFNVGASVLGINNMYVFDNVKNPSVTRGFNERTTEIAQNYFAIVGLDYKDRYLFDGMFRYDGSSLFGPESRWNPYYRVSGAYRVSQDFTIPGIDELKVRVAYGTAGLRPGYDWQYEIYTLNSGVPQAFQKGNKALKPSVTTEAEFGLNVNFLGKFSFEGTFAKSVTTDQFLNRDLIPYLTDGQYRSEWINAGSVESNTLEFTLGANWLKGKSQDFLWNTNIVFSRVRQKITSLPIPPYWLDTPSGDVNAVYIQEGSTYGGIFGNRHVTSLADMEKQLPVGETIGMYEINSDGYVILAGTEGTINERPVKQKNADGTFWVGQIGDANANFNMGIANTLNYKGIQFYVLLDWKNGGDVYNANNQRLAFNNRSALQDMSDVPAEKKKARGYYGAELYNLNTATEYWVEDASYLKVREVAIGYTIPRKLLSGVLKGAIKGIEIKAVGRNLFTFTKYSGYDPEVGTILQPIDGIGASPIYRTMALSLGFTL